MLIMHYQTFIYTDFTELTEELKKIFEGALCNYFMSMIKMIADKYMVAFSLNFLPQAFFVIFNTVL